MIYRKSEKRMGGGGSVDLRFVHRLGLGAFAQAGASALRSTPAGCSVCHADIRTFARANLRLISLSG
jgi:hypothetical protein